MFNWILGGAAVGLGYLAWRNIKRQQEAEDKKNGDGEVDTLAEICAKIPDDGSYASYYKAYCEGLNALGDLVGGINNQLNQAEEREAERSKKNEELNGEIAIPNTVPLYQSQQAVKPTTGSALRFKNGCEPFEGAPGWTKCEPGTNDMRTHVVDGRFPASYEKVRAAAPTREQYFANPEKPIDWSGLLKGSVSPEYPDPATQGPFPMPDGTAWWWIRGEKLQCPTGQAPAMWNADGSPIRDQRTGLPSCAPGGIVAVDPNSPGSQGGTNPVDTTPGDHETASLDCNADGTAPAGYTWTGTAWRRLMPGETADPGPCGRKYDLALHFGDLATMVNG